VKDQILRHEVTNIPRDDISDKRLRNIEISKRLVGQLQYRAMAENRDINE
jgi:hypothetical protein